MPINDQDNHDCKTMDSALIHLSAHNVYYVKLNPSQRSDVLLSMFLRLLTFSLSIRSYQNQ